MKAITYLLTVLACGFAGYAVAADLSPRSASPMSPPAASWAGFYLGVDGGLTLDAPFKFDTGAFTDATKVNPRGGTFGGHAGHTWQSGSFVYGLEVFAAWNGSSKTVALEEGANLNTKVDYFGSASAILGVTLFNDAVLVYGRGGLGFAHTAATVTEVLSAKELAVGVVPESASAFEVHYGPVIGAGAAWRVLGSPNWLLRVDYQHYMLNKVSYGFGGAAQVNVPASLNLDVITAGLSYKFNP